MPGRSVRLMGRMNRAGELLIRMRAGETVPLRDTNPYVREACAMHDLILTAPELSAGFPEVFPHPQRPVWAEVGCYLGETLAAMAVHNGNLNFLGVDIRYKRVVKSARRARQEGLENVRIVLCDAAVFLDALPPGSLAGVNVFFPDPWPRPRHRKHRFVNLEFLQRTAVRCRPGGVFWFKTDQEDYFNEVLDLAPRAGFQPDRVPPEILGGADFDSFFQRLFHHRPEGVFQAVLKLKS